MQFANLSCDSGCMTTEMTGGALAGLLACPLYGDHAEWMDPLFPWGDKHHDKNVACHSAVSSP